MENWGLEGPTGPQTTPLAPSRHLSTCQGSFYFSGADKIIRMAIK